MRVRSAASALPALLLVAAGCGGGDNETPPPRQTVYRDSRYAFEVTLPPGWQRARMSLTPNLDDPREILAAATFGPLRPGGSCAQFPSAALAGMPRDAALVELQERAGKPTPEFRPRPPHFTASMGIGDSEVNECVPRPRKFDSRWIWVRDGRRFFHVLVALGKDAPASLRQQAFSLLDSLRFGRFRPDWRSAG
jgi:hypothetical protein